MIHPNLPDAYAPTASTRAGLCSVPARFASTGAPAIVLLFTGSQPRQITALTVGINCSDGNPNTLSVKNIG